VPDSSDTTPCEEATCAAPTEAKSDPEIAVGGDKTGETITLAAAATEEALVGCKSAAPCTFAEDGALREYADAPYETPTMPAEEELLAREVARQAKLFYPGRTPTRQERAWLVPIVKTKLARQAQRAASAPRADRAARVPRSANPG
jgi:hypothetical protein